MKKNLKIRYMELMHNVGDLSSTAAFYLSFSFKSYSNQAMLVSRPPLPSVIIFAFFLAINLDFF